MCEICRSERPHELSPSATWKAENGFWHHTVHMNVIRPIEASWSLWGSVLQKKWARGNFPSVPASDPK